MIQLYKTDKRDIKFLSNFNEDVEVLRNNYNKNARDVDIYDENESFYSIERRNKKWWKKIFYFGVEMPISNSKIM